jgi:hypothetical protein
MASNFDYQTDGYNAGNLLAPNHPVSISALDTALNTYNSTSYSTQRLNAMSYRDKLYAARLHKVTVSTPLPSTTNYPN